MLDGVERDATHHGCGVVAKVARSIAVCRLMDSDGEKHRQCVDQYGLYEFSKFHALIVSDTASYRCHVHGQDIGNGRNTGGT